MNILKKNIAIQIYQNKTNIYDHKLQITNYKSQITNHKITREKLIIFLIHIPTITIIIQKRSNRKQNRNRNDSMLSWIFIVLLKVVPYTSGKI